MADHRINSLEAAEGHGLAFALEYLHLGATLASVSVLMSRQLPGPVTCPQPPAVPLGRDHPTRPRETLRGTVRALPLTVSFSRSSDSRSSILLFSWKFFSFSLLITLLCSSSLSSLGKHHMLKQGCEFTFIIQQKTTAAGYTFF